MFEKEAEKWVKNNLHSTEEDYTKPFNTVQSPAITRVITMQKNII